MGPARIPVAERFWPKVQKTDGCWLWTGCQNGAGYGAINPGTGRGVMDRAHRVSWRLHFGEIPDGLAVCHHCDNRLCVRPDHLFLGTRDDNNKDMAQKGRARGPRYNKGERHGMARLTEEQIVNIRNSRAVGFLLRELAERYAVSVQQIHRIVTRKGWSHV